MHGLLLALVFLASPPFPTESPSEWRPALIDGRAQGPIYQSGRWRTESSTLKPKKKARIWQPDADESAFADGSVQIRFVDPAHAKGTLFVRGTRRKGRLWSGQGIRLRGRRAAFVRVERGKVRVLKTFRFRSFFRRKAVDITLTALGGTLIGRAVDPADGTDLGVAFTDDAPMKKGQPGFAPHRRWRGAMSHLATRSACAHAIPNGVEVQGPPVVLHLADRHLDSLPRGRVLEPARGPGGRSVVHTDLAGLEALYCADTPVARLVNPPVWRHRDLRYFEARGLDLDRLRRAPEEDVGYTNPEMLAAQLEGLAERYPRHARLVRLGTSHQGRPIFALNIADEIKEADPRPAVLLTGAHHGNELLSIDFVMDAARQLLDAAAHPSHAGPDMTRRLRGLSIWLVPLVNPDGNHRYLERSPRAGRKNGRDVDGDGRLDPLEGVDLNRNYPFRWGALGEEGSRSDPASVYYRGTGPATEPEVRAVMRLAEQVGFAASLSYHTGTIAVLSPYTIDGVEGPAPDLSDPLAKGVARAMGQHPQGRPFPVLKNLYPVDGVDQDWLLHRFGTQALLVEGALWAPTDPERRQAVIDTVRPSWMWLMDRLLDGPTLAGTVTDARGRPVAAEVSVEEITLNAEERWLSRCRDGRFDRMLPRKGRYTLVVQVPGHGPIKRKVRVKGHEIVNVRLPFAVRARCPERLEAAQ